jgi:hypothetical protein
MLYLFPYMSSLRETSSNRFFPPLDFTEMVCTYTHDRSVSVVYMCSTIVNSIMCILDND